MEPTYGDVKVKRNVICKLTEDETLSYSREMAKACQDKKAAEDNKKEAMSDFSARINRIDAEINELSRKVSNGYEYRDVECLWTYRWDDDTKDLIRQDTFELVKSEAIEQHERQEKLV